MRQHKNINKIKKLLTKSSNIETLVEVLGLESFRSVFIKELLKKDEVFNSIFDIINSSEKRSDQAIGKLLDNVIDNDKDPENIIKRISFIDNSAKNRSLLLAYLKKFLGKVSFSQTGEDIIVDYIFETLGIENPSYIDIGAFDPFHMSNTALFYLKGARGINIEPNPENIKLFTKHRPEDKNLNIGVSTKNEELTYFHLTSNSLNTFSEEAAVKYVEENGEKITKKEKIKVKKIGNILKEYNDGKWPDFMSLDVEGLDFKILKGIDFKKDWPKVICVETISYSTSGNGIKDKEIIDFLAENGYINFADTYINNIFVRKDLWKR